MPIYDKRGNQIYEINPQGVDEIYYGSWQEYQRNKSGLDTEQKLIDTRRQLSDSNAEIGRFKEKYAFYEQGPKAGDIKSITQYGMDNLRNLAGKGSYGQQFEGLANQYGGLFSQYSQSPDASQNLLNMANRPELEALASGRLTGAEEEAYTAALGSIDQGRGAAEKRIEDTTRSEATSRGLFSSRGAIANEAAGIAELDKYAGSQRAALLQGRAALSREGVNTGTALMSNLYGQAAQAQQSRSGILGGLLSGQGQAYGSATEQNRYLASLYQGVSQIGQQGEGATYREPPRQKFLGIF